MSLPAFRSPPAATAAAKLWAKLDAGGSGLWHMSLRYKLFLLNREKGKRYKLHWEQIQDSDTIIMIFNINIHTFSYILRRHHFVE